METSKKFYQRPIFWIIFALVYTVIIARYCKVELHDTGYGRGWYYGDGFSEKNVESAARFYMEKGFKPNYGLPTYLYNDTTQGDEYVYTHYPPMAEWIGGMVAKVSGDYSDKTISLFPLVLSVFLFFMIFKILARWLNNDHAAFIGASILVLSNYFISWADDIHQHLYIEFFRWSFVYLWWLYLTKEDKKWHLIPVLVICYAMMCLLSFEPYVYTAIVVVGFPIALKKKVVRWEVALLLIVPVLAFGLRLYLNAAYLGSFAKMLEDMRGALVNRTGGAAETSELQRKMDFNDYFYLLPEVRLHRLGHFYIFPSLVVIFLSILGCIQLKKHNSVLFRMALVIYIAAISWIFVMPQHALIHIFTLRHIAIFIGMVIGFGLIRYRKMVTSHWNERQYLLITLDVIVIGYSIVYAAINTVYFVYLKYGLLYPHLGKDNFELIDHFLF